MNRFLSRWFGQTTPRVKASTSSGKRRVRLDLEQLEARDCPAVITVDSIADTVNPFDNLVTLREAITAANADEVPILGTDFTGNVSGTFGDDSIVFDTTVFATAQTITLSLGTLLIDDSGQSLTITGSTAGVTIDGNLSASVFTVNADAIANLDNLTITRGSALNGGGINNAGALSVINSTITANAASTAGGGIYNTGDLLVNNSTISFNTGINGAGLYNSNGDIATISNSTFNNNIASGSGGGLYNNSGTLNVDNSTFSLNSATTGGGIYNVSTLNLTNSTVSANVATPNLANVGGGLFNAGTAVLNGVIVGGNFSNSGASADDIGSSLNVTGSNNLIGIGGSGGLTDGQDGNQVGVSVANIGLSPLADNGGPTQTMALSLTSFALARGNIQTTATTDQRGVARPINQRSDVGAFQLSVTPTVTANPSNRTIYAGGSATFTATATDGVPAGTTVQWQYSTDGVNWTNLTNGGNFSGVTTTTLTVSGALTSLGGYRFRAVFSNSVGLTATSTAALLTVHSNYTYAAYINAYYSYVYSP